jgi:3'-phosphoadenosine 5'-phosphosulfate (PAPS) 3'-phosphatase
MPTVYQEELTTAAAAARAAGGVIRDLYDRAAASAHLKGDGSPVTDADLAADRIIRDALTRAFPTDGILTEESGDDVARLQAQRCWLVDPLDGTKQFIERTGEFDVLIALVVDGRPVLGVAFQPTTGLLLTAIAGQGAWIERDGRSRPLHFQPAQTPPRLATSIWFGAPESLPVVNRVAARLGAPPPDVLPIGIYTRNFAPPDNPYDAVIGMTTNFGAEWDFATSDIIIHEAGGRMTDIAGQLHRYNKPDVRNRNGVVVSVDPDTHNQIIAALNREPAAAPPVGEAAATS